jgi:hypothetical protein
VDPSPLRYPSPLRFAGINCRDKLPGLLFVDLEEEEEPLRQFGNQPEFVNRQSGAVWTWKGKKCRVIRERCYRIYLIGRWIVELKVSGGDRHSARI